MFTGLVEEVGVITEIRSDGENAVTVFVRCAKVHEGAAIGDSISINGCCLTVVEIDSDVVAFQAGEETLSRTNLGKLTTGSRVNLERALKAGDRLGGHYVSGHVDSLGTVNERNDDDQWAEFWFEVPEEWTRQMAGKGSVAVDGISLTLVKVEKTRFSVALIPHTLAETTMGDRNVGDTVNIETDILAKYVQQQLQRMEIKQD